MLLYVFLFFALPGKSNPSAGGDSLRLAHDQLVQEMAEADEQWNEQAHQETEQRAIEAKELAEADEHADRMDDEEARQREQETLEMHRREEEERRMHDDEAELLDRLTEKERREAFEWSYENKKNSTHHEEEIQELLAAEQRDGLIQAEKLHEAEYHAHLKSQEKEAGAIRMDEDSQYHSSIPSIHFARKHETEL
jgi:hypothetical protein